MKFGRKFTNVWESLSFKMWFCNTSKRNVLGKYSLIFQVWLDSLFTAQYVNWAVWRPPMAECKAEVGHRFLGQERLWPCRPGSPGPIEAELHPSCPKGIRSVHLMDLVKRFPSSFFRAASSFFLFFTLLFPLSFFSGAGVWRWISKRPSMVRCLAVKRNEKTLILSCGWDTIRKEAETNWKHSN